MYVSSKYRMKHR